MTVTLALALTLAWPAPAGAPQDPVPLEVALPDRSRSELAVVEAAAPPLRVELEPGGLALASSWYRLGERVLVTTLLPASLERARLRLESGAARGGLRLLGVIPARELPLQAPVAGEAIALRLPARESLRSLLLSGELEGAALLFEGRRLDAREGPRATRVVTLLPPGAPAILVVASGEAGRELVVRGASLHAGYPLPSPERYRLGPGGEGEYTFEVAERRDPALLAFEVEGVASAGALRVDFEGETVYVSEGPLGPPGGRTAAEVLLPAGRFARGRPSLVSFHLRSPAAPAAGIELGNLTLDVPLPARGPFAGPAARGAQPGLVLLTWWAEAGVPQRLRLHAAGLETPGAIEVVLGGVVLSAIGPEGGRDQRDVVIDLPAELVRAGLNAIELRADGDPALASWTVSDLAVEALISALPVAASAPAAAARPEGPAASMAPLGLPGSAALSAAEADLLAPPGLPGQAAEPVGETLTFAVPVLEPVPGKPPGWVPAEDPPAAPASLSLAPGAGPVAAHAALDGEPGGEPLPGGASLIRGPWVAPPWPAELPAVDGRAEPGGGSMIAFGSTPSGAAVFGSRAPGHRGTFLGLTPFRAIVPAPGAWHYLISRAGSHDAWLWTRLEPGGRLAVDRTLLPFRGLDFDRPRDPRTAVGAATLAFAAPAAVDLDGDGRIDLVVGLDTGELVWMRDLAPAGPPRFGLPEPLRKDDGRPVAVGGYAVPALEDWDGDGRMDLLVGSQDGEVRLLLGTPADLGLAFADAGPLLAGGEPLRVGNDAAPLVADLDGDSRLDLLVGSGYGTLTAFRRDRNGELMAGVRLLADGQARDFLLNVSPIDVADWDGDGLADLVLATMPGEVRIYPAQAGATPMGFAAPRRLTVQGGLPLFAGTYPRGFALDLDGDGFRDLLLGNAAGEIHWLRGGEPGEFDGLLPLWDDEPAP